MNLLMLAAVVIFLNGDVILDHRSTDGVKPDMFPTMEACQEALEQDKPELEAYLAGKAKAFAMQCVTPQDYDALKAKIKSKKEVNKGV